LAALHCVSRVGFLDSGFGTTGSRALPGRGGCCSAVALTGSFSRARTPIRRPPFGRSLRAGSLRRHRCARFDAFPSAGCAGRLLVTQSVPLLPSWRSDG